MSRVLIIEDEPQMVMGLTNALEMDGYQVDSAGDGRQGLVKARQAGLGLILLDIMLPGLDGREICRRLRAEHIHTPIIMLTAKGTPSDKVEGLEVGADDYVTKPFSIAELLARIKAMLRRSQRLRPQETSVFTAGDRRVDLEAHAITIGRQELPLTHYEVQILRLLLRAAGEPVSRAELLREIWGESFDPGSRTVDFHVANLRRKLERNAERPQHLLTAHGLGYALRVERR